MTQTYGKLVGWGAHVPERVVTNHEVEKYVDTNHDWIVQRTGIHERRWANREQDTAATLAAKAAQNALDKANLDPQDLDFILVATTAPDFHTPSVANQVQHLIGAKDTPAMMINCGCSGFVYGLSTAYQFLQTGAYRRVLVVGVEFLSRFADWEDRGTAVLFGDGAGAVILEATDEPCGVESFTLGSDGGSAQHLMFPATTELEPVLIHDGVDKNYIRFNGREIFKFAARVLGRACVEVTQAAGVYIPDIDWIIPHQANLRIIQFAAQMMDIPLEKFYINIEKYGNTSAAAIPIALAEGLDSGQIKLTDRILLVAFGAGLTWGACVWQLTPPPVAQPEPELILTTAVNGHRA